MTILLDFGGTLDADGVRWSARFHAAYRRAGGCLSFARFEPLFQRSDWQLAQAPAIRRAGFRATLDAQAELLSALLAEQGESVDPAALAGPVHRSALAVVARNRPLLARLATEHRLGVVSNFTGNLDVCLAELDLMALFEVVVDSAHVGVAKPDPRIFRLALASLGAESATTWMIGDNPAADLLPAAALGLKTCWLAPADDLRLLPPGVPTARVETLLDLPRALDVPCTV